MWKIAVCDDKKREVEAIKREILAYGKECDIDCFYSGEELLSKSESYDIIFLDIDMQGIDGIEAAKQIRERDKNVKIIYVTSYTDYVNYAFSVHAFAYLLKPVKREELHRQLQEADSYYKEKRESRTIRFTLKDGTTVKTLDEIYFMEYKERHVSMKTADGEYWLIGSISEVSERMEPYGFAVPHKSFCVNLSHVKNVKGYDVFMMNGDVIPLSQKKSVEFREKLHKFLAECI